MTTESDEELFRKLLNLINTNMVEAIVQSRNLTEDQRENFQKYLANMTLHTESARYRGRVIEMSIYLEMIIAKVLSNYFAKKEKTSLLNSMIFDRMDLQRKVNTFKNILKTQHPKIWKKESTVIKKLDKLISFRNNIAHSMLNSSPNYTKKLREKVDDLTKTGQRVDKMDEIEFGFYENHKFTFTTVKWSEVEDFHKGIVESIMKIEEIAKQIIEDYE